MAHYCGAEPRRPLALLLQLAAHHLQLQRSHEVHQDGHHTVDRLSIRSFSSLLLPYLVFVWPAQQVLHDQHEEVQSLQLSDASPLYSQAHDLGDANLPSESDLDNYDRPDCPVELHSLRHGRLLAEVQCF